jgi:hypothetical protein
MRGLSYNQIAAHVSVGHHTTVLIGIRRFKHLCTTSPKYQALIDRCRYRVTFGAPSVAASEPESLPTPTPPPPVHVSREVALRDAWRASVEAAA